MKFAYLLVTMPPNTKETINIKKNMDEFQVNFPNVILNILNIKS
jgi:hypothetical protein